MKKNLLKLFSIAALILLIANANAQQDSIAKKDTTEKKQRFNILVGAFFPTVATKLKINGTSGRVGTDVGLEETFGLTQNPSVFRVDGLYQMTRRSSFKATYFQMNRKKTWVIDHDITVADTTFNIGADIDFHFNTQYFALSYRYGLIARKDFQAGLSFGVRWLSFETGAKVVSDSINKEFNTQFGVPVVLFGINVSGNILPRLVGRYDFELFKLSFEGIQGLVYENRFSLEYYFTKNIGVGGAFNAVLYSVKEFPLSDNFNGEVKFTMNGLSLFAAVKF
ncbi:MAG: hypothetical protein ABI723_14410 [Bacteroidia bacterium]